MELIDGNPVVSHVVRFKDRTTISETDAEAVRDGAVIVWLVRTVCEPPSYHPVRKDSDDRYRFNIQDVKAAAVLHGELRDGALAYLDDPSQAQGRFVFTSPIYDGDGSPEKLGDNGALVTDGGMATVFTSADLDALDVSDDDRVSIYGPGGSEAQRLLQQWDEL